MNSSADAYIRGRLNPTSELLSRAFRRRLHGPRGKKTKTENRNTEFLEWHR